MAEDSKASLRTYPVQFRDTPLLEADCPADPLELFQRWMEEALQHHPGDPNAMTLSTVRQNGQPVSRIVLLKEFGPQGFVFYTNYKSHKALELAANPKGCLLFYWHGLGRQIQLQGQIAKVPASESDAYFQSRPRDSQLGAYASPQSEVIPDRSFLDQNFARLRAEYGDEKTIPRPEHWGGYTLQPEQIEFWQGRASRLHDRMLYEKKDEQWTTCRLAP